MLVDLFLNYLYYVYSNGYLSNSVCEYRNKVLHVTMHPIFEAKVTFIYQVFYTHGYSKQVTQNCNSTFLGKNFRHDASDVGTSSTHRWFCVSTVCNYQSSAQRYFTCMVQLEIKCKNKSILSKIKLIKFVIFVWISPPF